MFLAVMLQQSLLSLDIESLLQIPMSSYMNSMQTRISTYDEETELFTRLNKSFPGRLTVCYYQLNDLTYLFVNASPEELSACELVKELCKAGYRYKNLNIPGVPKDKLVCYDSESDNYVISNVTGWFDTGAVNAVGSDGGKKEMMWQHPIQMVYVDMYNRIQKNRELSMMYS